MRSFCVSLLLTLGLLGASFPAVAAPKAVIAIASKKKAGPITRIDPTFWWVGMKNPKLQLLVYGPNISASKVSLKYAGVSLDGVQKLESPNYLLVNLTISPNTKPGKLPLEFQGERNIRYDYELRARSQEIGRVQGVTSADFVYLLLPDRFANGDPRNDVVKGTLASRVARDSMYARHGGDLQGIENHFDYLKELGVTAIWPTPVVENDMPKASYHGYALTDYYAVDSRYGTNEDYVRFVRNAHRNGLKVIHDVVLNHLGNKNYLYLDQPAKDWFHQPTTFTRSNHRDAAFNDPYASQADRQQFGEGWFDATMPDVDQSNPLVVKYLIQNFLWWVEYTGLDGYHLDAYPYSDRKFLMEWGAAIQEQYPQLGLYGEARVQGNEQQAYFARNILPPVDGFKANLPGITDFQSQNAITAALTKDASWTDGIAKLYLALQGDWMYEDAMRNVVFLDNHDLSRFFSVVGEDVAKLKMALSWLLTTRGIPQLYYGTEILMKNLSNPDGLVRADFPGGFSGDKQNKFTAAGRSAPEQEVFTLVSKLAGYRKAHPALHSGKLMQFVPQEGVYTYFRYSDAGTVMVLMNSNKEAKVVDGGHFAERLDGFTSAVDVVSGAAVADLKMLRVPGRTALVLELRK